MGRSRPMIPTGRGNRGQGLRQHLVDKFVSLVASRGKALIGKRSAIRGDAVEREGQPKRAGLALILAVHPFGIVADHLCH